MLLVWASLSSWVGQQQCMPTVAAAEEPTVHLMLARTVQFNELHQTIAITEAIDAELKQVEERSMSNTGCMVDIDACGNGRSLCQLWEDLQGF